MPCPEYEDLLAAYAELAPSDGRRVDAHLQDCLPCRAWLEALAEVDATLATAFGDIHAPRRLAPAVESRVARSLPARISAVPEILDFVGWLGVICAAAVLAYFLIPLRFTLSAPLLIAVSGILLFSALSVTVWILRISEG